MAKQVEKGGVQAINIGGIYFPLYDKEGYLPEIKALDKNGDKAIDDLDGCDEKCRTDAYVGLFLDGAQKHRELFLDLVKVLGEVHTAYSRVFCESAFPRIPISLREADLSKPPEPGACCAPVEYIPILFADSALRTLANKYGWGHELAFARVLKKNDQEKKGELGLASALGGELVAVPVYSVPAEQANELTGGVLMNIANEWQAIATLMIDQEKQYACKPRYADMTFESMMVYLDSFDKAVAFSKRGEEGKKARGLPVPRTDVARSYIRPKLTLPLITVGVRGAR